MSTINEKFKERLKYLNNNSKISPPTNIKPDTFNKYLRGDRFPSAENLEIIKEHYHVSYSYLFGEFDNDDLKTTKESIVLGLDKDIIDKLNNIQKTNDKITRENKNYAINTFLREIDFNLFGMFLSFPSYKNDNISSENYYKYYAKFFETDIPKQIISCIRENNELSSYKINRQVTNLCEKARKTKKCVDIFELNLEAKEKQEEERLQSEIVSYYSSNEEDFNDNMIDYTKLGINDLIYKRKKNVLI